jgi:hypothetical protein
MVGEGFAGGEDKLRRLQNTIVTVRTCTRYTQD